MITLIYPKSYSLVVVRQCRVYIIRKASRDKNPRAQGCTRGREIRQVPCSSRHPSVYPRKDVEILASSFGMHFSGVLLYLALQ